MHFHANVCTTLQASRAESLTQTIGECFLQTFAGCQNMSVVPCSALLGGNCCARLMRRLLVVQMLFYHYYHFFWQILRS